MIRLIAFIFVALILTSCGSSKKLYQHGNYDQAIHKSVKKLRGNSENTKEMNVLEKSYNAANDINNSRIKFLKTSFVIL